MAEVFGVLQFENAIILFGSHPYLLHQKDPSVPYDKVVISEYLFPKKQKSTTCCERANRESVRKFRVM
jgi:hypothetical protein